MENLTFRILAPPASTHSSNHSLIWESQKFCLYPVSLWILLDYSVSQIQRLQILTHHYKIPSTIHISYATSPVPHEILDLPDYVTTANSTSSASNSDLSKSAFNSLLDSVQYTKIGYSNFTDNFSTGFKARELKTVYFPKIGGSGDSTAAPSTRLDFNLDDNDAYAAANITSNDHDEDDDDDEHSPRIRLIRLDIKACHVNPLNLYNQTAIIAINIIGRISDPAFLLSKYTTLSDGTTSTSWAHAAHTRSSLPHTHAMASLLLNHHDMDDEIDFGKVGGDDDKSGGGGKREKKMNRGRVVSKELFDLADDTHYSLLALTSAQDDAHMVVLVGAIRRAKEIAVREEKYSVAKALKVLHELAETTLASISSHSLTKQRAIEVEDYDLAAALKADINALQAAFKDKMHRLGFMIEDPAGGDLDGESRGGRGGRVLRVVPFVEHEHDGNNRYGGGMAGGGSFGRHNHPPMTTEYTIDTPRDNRDHQQQQQHQQFIPESHSLPPLPSALVSPQPPPITVNQPTTDEKQHLHQPPLPTVRSSSPIIPALQKKLNGGTAPISMDSEYPDPDQAAAAASKPKKKFLQRKKTGDPNGYSSKRGSLDDASQQQQKSGGGGPLQLPIGEEPEVLDPDLVTPFAPVIKVHGELIVRCVLSKTFKLREFGLGVVGNRLDIWDDRQVARRASKDNLSTPTTAAPNTGKVRLSKLVSTNIIPKDLNDQMVDGFGWGDETPLPSPDLLIQSTMLIIMNGIDDTRDKVTILCIGLWELITRLCARNKIPDRIFFPYIEKGVPMLLIKIADGNPRIKQGSADLFVTIASSYHIIPHSALPLLLSSFSTVSATSLSKGLGNVGKQRANAGGDKVGVDADVHWRFIKARLDLLAKCISEFGIDEDESANDGTAAGASSADPPSGKKSTANVELAAAKKAESSLKKRLKGLNVDNIMKFTTRFLTHTNAEVREAGASVVVELVLIVGETIVSPYIKDAQSTATTPGVTPHLVRLIREKIKAARIAKGGAKLGASAVSQGQSKDAVLLEKKSQDKLDKLKVELEELKEIVEDEAGILNVNELKGPSSIHNSKANSTKAAPSASTPKQRGGAAEKEVEDDPQVCIFCDTRNKEFETNEEVLNNHFFEECAMLCKCPLCATIVEVQSLTFHMLAECDDRSLVSQCKNCREAILKKDYSNHTAKGTCKKAIDMSIRCPLCHNDVEEGNEGWRNHLLRLGSGACPANPRKQRRKSVVGEGAKPSASSTTTAALTAPEPPPSLKITAPSQDRLAGISDEEDEEGSPTTPTQASLSKTKQPAAKATTAAASTKLLVSSLKHFHDPSSPPPPRKNVKIILPTDDSD